MRCRTDANQPAIVEALRNAGVPVLVVSSQGIGFDLICNYRGVWLVEVKAVVKDSLTTHEGLVRNMFGKNYLVITNAVEFFERVEHATNS